MKLRCNRTVKHRAAVSNEGERRKTTILLISLPRSRLIQNKKLFSPLFFAGRRRLLRKEMQTSFEEVKRASLRSLTMATEPGAGFGWAFNSAFLKNAFHCGESSGGNFQLFCSHFLRITAPRVKSLLTGKRRRRWKNWKIFMMLMVSGALRFRLNILKDTHSSLSKLLPCPRDEGGRSSGKKNQGERAARQRECEKCGNVFLHS